MICADLNWTARTFSVSRDVSGLLAEIVADAEFEARSSRKSVRLRGKGPLIVLGDAEPLASCFENVIRNALRHTHPSTAVEIAVSVDEAAGIGRVATRDHGDGVPEDQLHIAPGCWT